MSPVRNLSQNQFFLILKCSLSFIKKIYKSKLELMLKQSWNMLNICYKQKKNLKIINLILSILMSMNSGLIDETRGHSRSFTNSISSSRYIQHCCCGDDFSSVNNKPFHITVAVSVCYLHSSQLC